MIKIKNIKVFFVVMLCFSFTYASDNLSIQEVDAILFKALNSSEEELFKPSDVAIAKMLKDRAFQLIAESGGEATTPNEAEIIYASMTEEERNQYRHQRLYAPEHPIAESAYTDAFAHIQAVIDSRIAYYEIFLSLASKASLKDSADIEESMSYFSEYFCLDSLLTLDEERITVIANMLKLIKKKIDIYDALKDMVDCCINSKGARQSFFCSNFLYANIEVYKKKNDLINDLYKQTPLRISDHFCEFEFLEQIASQLRPFSTSCVMEFIDLFAFKNDINSKGDDYICFVDYDSLIEKKECIARFCRSINGLPESEKKRILAEDRDRFAQYIAKIDDEFCRAFSGSVKLSNFEAFNALVISFDNFNCVLDCAGRWCEKNADFVQKQLSLLMKAGSSISPEIDVSQTAKTLKRNSSQPIRILRPDPENASATHLMAAISEQRKTQAEENEKALRAYRQAQERELERIATKAPKTKKRSVKDDGGNMSSSSGVAGISPHTTDEESSSDEDYTKFEKIDIYPEWIQQSREQDFISVCGLIERNASDFNIQQTKMGYQIGFLSPETQKKAVFFVHNPHGAQLKKKWPGWRKNMWKAFIRAGLVER